jgi:hypothetical protein
MLIYLPSRHRTIALFCSLLLVFAAVHSAQAAQKLFAATGFASSSGELYILNPVDGSIISDVGRLNDAQGKNYSLTGLRYDPSTGLLFGITGSSPTAPSSLVIVDQNTALVTYVGGPFSSRLSDIAIQPGTFEIYAISGSSKYFYTIDKTTGEDTKIGNTLLPPNRGGGFASNAAGILYGTNDSQLSIYDDVTGEAAAVGNTNLAFFVGALAFSPDGLLYGIEGGGTTGMQLDSDSESVDESDPDTINETETSIRQRWLVIINSLTGAATELGETVGNLNALAFVP